MRWHKLPIAQFYFKLYIFETAPEMRKYLENSGNTLVKDTDMRKGKYFSESMRGGCEQVGPFNKCGGSIYIAKDMPTGSAIHEIFHAVHHIYNQKKKQLHFVYESGEFAKFDREEWLAGLLGEAVNNFFKIVF